MENAARCVKESALMIGRVPASPEHWGVEDDIAGHYRRYPREGLNQICPERFSTLVHHGGIAYPAPNFLSVVSDCLIARADIVTLGYWPARPLKIGRPMGLRHVPFEIQFPAFTRINLKQVSIMPLDWLQRLSRNFGQALVSYLEGKPLAS